VIDTFVDGMTAMTIASTSTADPISIVITANGTLIPASCSVISVHVWSEVNKVPGTRLVLSGGNDPARLAALMDGASLAPKAGLNVAFGSHGHVRPVFAGTIQQLELDISGHGPATLTVEAADQSAIMTQARGTAFHQNLTDSQLIELLLDRAQLKRMVKPTTLRHPIIMQPDGNDWDLMVQLARASGMVVTVDQGTVTVAPPATGAAPRLALVLGESMLSVQAVLDGAVTPSPSRSQGRGRVGFNGFAGVRIGDMIGLAGVGEALGGNAYVLAVQHRIDQGNWLSSVEFGPPPVIKRQGGTVSVFKPPSAG